MNTEVLIYDAFRRMRPDNSRFPGILKEIPNSSAHPFTPETVYKTSTMHGRHFSSPVWGTVEDPVTKIASGAMGAYCRRHIANGTAEGVLCLMAEQGQEIGKCETLTGGIPFRFFL